MGQVIFFTSIEGDAKWLNVIFLPIGKDLLGKEARACLRRKGLMAALFLVLKEMNLLKYCMAGLL